MDRPPPIVNPTFVNAPPHWTWELAHVAGVVRNNEGHWLVGFHKPIFAINALHAELQGLMEGLRIAKDLKHTHLVIMTDSKKAVNMLHHPLRGTDFFTDMLNLCRELLQCFQETRIIFINRELNKLADSLVKYCSTTCDGSDVTIAHHFIDNADSVIHFLKQHDFELSHIRKMVCYHPPILSANVDKTLKPKFKILQELGFSGCDLMNTILATPCVLLVRLSHLVQVLRNVSGSNENVVIFLKKIKGMWLSPINKHLSPNVKLLEDSGIPLELIRKHILQRPHIFVQRTQLFLELMTRVEHEFGISCNSKMFLSAVAIMSTFGDKCIARKMEVFKSLGWTQSDVKALIRKYPYCLGLSEANIRNKLNFFMKELGYEPAYLLSRWFLLSFSLEKRVLPRYKVLLALKERDLIRMDYPLYNTLYMSESKFVKVLVSPYKQVHQVYTQLTGHMLKILSKGTTCEDAIRC